MLCSPCIGGGCVFKGVTLTPDFSASGGWPILPQASAREGVREVCDRGCDMVRQGISPTALTEWHVSLRDQLYLRGLRTNTQVLSAPSIIAHTTCALRLSTSTPPPYPKLTPGPQAPHETTGAACKEAESQLRFHHAGRGESMRMSRLLYSTTLDRDLFPPDDPAFEHLLLWQRMGLWHQDRGMLRHKLLALPKDVPYSVSELQHSLHSHGLDTTTSDDLPFSVMAGLGHNGMCVLRVYLRRLSAFPDAVSN